MFKEIDNWHPLDLKLRLGFFTYNKNGKTSLLTDWERREG